MKQFMQKTQIKVYEMIDNTFLQILISTTAIVSILLYVTLDYWILLFLCSLCGFYWTLIVVKKMTDKMIDK